MHTQSIACAIVIALALPAAAAAQSSKTEELLRLTSAYVDRFISEFSNVVAEERYEQEVIRPRARRELRSEFLLVRYPGAQRWNAFRDVLEVDGKPVGEDRDVGPPSGGPTAPRCRSARAAAAR